MVDKDILNKFFGCHYGLHDCLYYRYLPCLYREVCENYKRCECSNKCSSCTCEDCDEYRAEELIGGASMYKKFWEITEKNWRDGILTPIPTKSEPNPDYKHSSSLVRIIDIDPDKIIGE